MSEFLSETEGCDLLARLFRARGYVLARNLLFRDYGVEFHIDGWDEKARVGFEFLSSEDDDHDDLTLSEYQTLSAAQQRGELSLFIIDEVEPLSAADLALQANDFLDEVAEAVRMRGVARPAGKRAAAKKKPAAAKAPVGTKKKKVVAKKATAKKSAVATMARTGTKARAVKKSRAIKKAAKKSAAPAVKKAAGKKTLQRKTARKK